MHRLFFLLPLLLVAIFSSKSTWTPFQSEQVKEIYSHMTEEERKRASRQGLALGALVGLLMGCSGFLGLPIGIWYFDSALKGVIAMQPVILIVAAIAAFILRPRMNQSQREILASTQWAKEEGLTSDRIKLYRFSQ